ncbi:MAG: gamma-glutamyl-gamma-aminobutyrate hydrolase family protein [Leptospiraceae bacterium]|nr:gamma-glutamyl-gamma-aminobutyrate hydrolase family protein [Leptospiraceae bacterium]MCP5493438.1 gamma-glutamyl-gamma-aminobutyrate hydrolase family protein [Leptospiraceae bacterium]
MLKIGISSCFFHPDITRPIFKGKRLLYIEECMTHYVMGTGNFPILIPTLNENLKVSDLVREIDGLVLHGGSDVSPISYGETPLKPEWSGDYFRDVYETKLLRECIKQNKPVLGICRGIQLVNVAFGGTLYQDIETEKPDAIIHRNWDIYENLVHEITFQKDSILNYGIVQVNSVHHQAIKLLGNNLVVEAISSSDGIIEAIRTDSHTSFVYGIQWHPEFQDKEDKSLFNRDIIFNLFLDEVKKNKTLS